MAAPSSSAGGGGVQRSRRRRRHWIFGYGSIMNAASRESTIALARCTADAADPPTPAAVLVALAPQSGYVREWHFRAPSGFTAVGLRQRRPSEAAHPICGILFPAGLVAGADAADDDDNPSACSSVGHTHVPAKARWAKLGAQARFDPPPLPRPGRNLEPYCCISLSWDLVPGRIVV